LSDCVVFPDVFDHLVDRLYDFVVPYQHALETEAGQRNVHLGIEACGGAHDWARRCRAYGHEVKLMAPPFVKPYGAT
jgi:transposase